MRVIGLMSGTSADGVDAALVEWPPGDAPRPFRLLAQREEPFPAELQQRIHALAAGRCPAAVALRELAALDVELGERFAAAARAVAQQAGVSLDDVTAIASHGQTVAHHPELGATLQIGDPSRIAERTGVTTVADFRPRDVAAGGEGAPLAPFFHFAAFADATENRLVLNLGGIANVTWLPAGAGPGDVIAFDVGPANALIDGVVSLATQGAERMDRDGRRALRGTVDAALLSELLDDDFLRAPPPKSTGRERYGLAEAETLLARWRDRPLDDLVATLLAFSAGAVGHACRAHLGLAPASSRGGLRPPAVSSGDEVAQRVSAQRAEGERGPSGGIARLLVGGGGTRNPAFLHALRAAVPGAAVEPFDAFGVPAGAAEAIAFALLGRNTLLGLPNHLPRTTGATAERVLGEIVPGRRGLRFGS